MPADAASSPGVVGPELASDSYSPSRTPSSTLASSIAARHAMNKLPANSSTLASSSAVNSIVDIGPPPDSSSMMLPHVQERRHSRDPARRHETATKTGTGVKLVTG